MSNTVYNNQKAATANSAKIQDPMTKRTSTIHELNDASSTNSDLQVNQAKTDDLTIMIKEKKNTIQVKSTNANTNPRS